MSHFGPRWAIPALNVLTTSEVRFFNAPIEGNRINSDDAAVDLLQRIHFDGDYPCPHADLTVADAPGPAMMGAALDYKVLQPLVLAPARQGALRKPKLVIVITDGSGSAYAEAPGTRESYTQPV